MHGFETEEYQQLIRAYSLKEKYEVVMTYRSGRTNHSQLSKDFDIKRPAIHLILKNVNKTIP